MSKEHASVQQNCILNMPVHNYKGVQAIALRGRVDYWGQQYISTTQAMHILEPTLTTTNVHKIMIRSKEIEKNWVKKKSQVCEKLHRKCYLSIQPLSV